MSMLTRMFIPRSVRRAVHPGRAVKRAVTPKVVKQARHAMHPIDNAVYSVERKLNTKPRKSRKPAKSCKPVRTAPSQADLAEIAGLHAEETFLATKFHEGAFSDLQAEDSLNRRSQLLAEIKWIKEGRRGARPVVTPEHY